MLSRNTKARSPEGVRVFSWIISSSLKYRFLVIFAAAALIVFGTEELRRMPIDVFPEFAPPKVEVQTEGMGMTSAEIEELITIPMEDALTSSPVGFDRAGDTVYFRDSRDRDTAGLFAWNLKTGEKKLLAEHEKADAGGTVAAPKTHRVQAVSFNYERQQWKVIDPAITFHCCRS